MYNYLWITSNLITKEEKQRLSLNEKECEGNSKTTCSSVAGTGVLESRPWKSPKNRTGRTPQNAHSQLLLHTSKHHSVPKQRRTRRMSASQRPQRIWETAGTVAEERPQNRNTGHHGRRVTWVENAAPEWRTLHTEHGTWVWLSTWKVILQLLHKKRKVGKVKKIQHEPCIRLNMAHLSFYPKQSQGKHHSVSPDHLVFRCKWEKKKYLAIHQLPSTLMFNDYISCYTVNATGGWAWWLLAEKIFQTFIYSHILLGSRFLCNYWLRRQGRYLKIVPKPCDICECVSPPARSPSWVTPCCRTEGAVRPSWLQVFRDLSPNDFCGRGWCSTDQTRLPTLSAARPGLGKSP